MILLLFCRTVVCWISQHFPPNLFLVDPFGNSQLTNIPYGPSLHFRDCHNNCAFSHGCLLHFPAGSNSRDCCPSGVVAEAISHSREAASP
uniref:ORFx protein n=1 Tax=NL63-related bat coronavirus TaxID=1920748 RepID=A0A1L2KGD5_9ALPC|nr:ORFx protein [NL63-related bat coronavirus]